MPLFGNEKPSSMLITDRARATEVTQAPVSVWVRPRIGEFAMGMMPRSAFTTRSRPFVMSRATSVKWRGLSSASRKP